PERARRRRAGETDRHHASPMLTVALEDRVPPHVDHDVQITRRATLGTGLAFAGQANALARVDACGHLHGKRLLFFDAALAVAAATGIGNHLAAAMAARAGLLHGEEALLHTHLTDATTGGTGDGAGALLGTGAITGLAFGQGRDANGHRRAAHGFFQIQLQRVTQIAAALGTTARTAAGA